MQGGKHQEQQHDAALAGAACEAVSVEGVMKAVLQCGNGPTPRDGDQVVFHTTMRTGDGAVCHSTRSEYGGSGVPRRVVLGHTRLLPGLEHGLRSMQAGETAVVKMTPAMHYGHPDCSKHKVVPPILNEGNDSGSSSVIPVDEELLVEVSVVRVDSSVKVVQGSEVEYEEGKRDRREKEGGKEEEGDGGVPLITKKVLAEGTGWETPRPPYEVVLSLQVRESSGTTSEHAGLNFTLGENMVPWAVEQGVRSMLQGERAINFAWEEAAATAASAPTGDGDGGPHATALIPQPSSRGVVEYDITLERIVQVRDVLGDGQVTKKRLVDGRGEFPVDCPLEDCVVRIHYRGCLLDEKGEGREVFVDTREEYGGEPLEVATGEGRLPEALETSVRVMLPGEKALVTSSAEHAYDSFRPRPDKVPEGARVQWEVELVSFDPPKRWDDLSFSEIMAEVARIKEAGNNLFKRQLYQLALAKYEKMVRELRNVHPQDDVETREWNATRVGLQLNVAACHHKLEDYPRAIEWADKVLAENSRHAKALFRRGQARMMSADFDEAADDFRQMMASDPSTTQDATAALATLRRLEKDARERQSRQLKGFLDRRPRSDLSGQAAPSDDGNRKWTALKQSGTSTDCSDTSDEVGSASDSDQGIRQRSRTFAQLVAEWLPTIIFLALVGALVLAGVNELGVTQRNEL